MSDEDFLDFDAGRSIASIFRTTIYFQEIMLLACPQMLLACP